VLIELIVGFLFLLLAVKIFITIVAFTLYWVAMSAMIFFLTFWMGPIGVALSIFIGFFAALGAI